MQNVEYTPDSPSSLCKISSSSGLPVTSTLHDRDKCCAIRIDRRLGVYASCAECEAKVKRFQGAQYRSFRSRIKAEEYISS
uniref:Ribonuclease H1 N-terminal domain-containing protein n=1 Tax=Physcomitrium patens TaxID=3218 RepID=A0A2K1K5U6_PHYPA|nr:hypothetical protein PHYPA_011049 [Physcomitrium patens]